MTKLTLSEHRHCSEKAQLERQEVDLCDLHQAVPRVRLYHGGDGGAGDDYWLSTVRGYGNLQHLCPHLD